MCICAFEHYLRFTSLSRNSINWLSFKRLCKFSIVLLESSVSILYFSGSLLSIIRINKERAKNEMFQIVFYDVIFLVY